MTTIQITQMDVPITVQLLQDIIAAIQLPIKNLYAF